MFRLVEVSDLADDHHLHAGRATDFHTRGQRDGKLEAFCTFGNLYDPVGDTLQMSNLPVGQTDGQGAVETTSFQGVGSVIGRPAGDAGEEKVLASVLEGLNTKDVPRLRMGIGSPPEGEEIIDYVLDSFSPEDEVEDLLERCEKALEKYYAEGVEAAMNSFNGS